jgi:hypothetical protein
MEIILDLMITWWQFTIVGALILVGLCVNMFGVDNDKELIGFSAKEMPHMQPIVIPTAGKGFWGAIFMWLMGTRTWTITKDYHFTIHGQNYVIPKGFTFDGASVPKFLASWLSPVGVLLVGGLVHDYIYKYEMLLKKGGKETSHTLTQKDADIIFRDINIEQNGFHLMNYLAYWALRLGGFVAWNGHRKRNCKIGE